MDFIGRLTLPPERAILPNGLRVFFKRTLPSGMVSVQVWVKSGSIHEGEFLGGGLSHYLEHMVFKGTEKFSAEEISRRVQAVGGNLNAYTTFTRTVYYIDVPAESVETAFEILSQMTLAPRLDSIDASREKDVILREIAMGEDDPDSRLYDATLAEAFRVYPFRIPVIGRKNVFCDMGERELKTYFEKRYVPELCSVIVAGDVSGEVIFSLAEKYFSRAPAKSALVPFIPEEPPQAASREITLRGNVQVLRGNVLWKVPGVGHESAPALAALAAVLGKGSSSLLWQELHEKRELVHAIDVSAWTPNENGLFWIGYVADNGRREEVESALWETIDKCIREKITKKLLKKVARQAIVGLVNSSRTTGSAAARLGKECVEIGDSASTKIFLDKLQKLTPEEIGAVAQRYLREETRTTSAFEKTLPHKKSVNPAGKSSSFLRTFPPFEEFRLASGIRVLLQPLVGYPKVNLRATLLSGSAFENEENKGASALLATLMTLDAGTRTADAVSEAIESVGGTFEEVPGRNTLSLVTETLSGDEEIAADILASGLFAPKFSTRNFSRERAAQLAALRSDYDEIEEFARIALTEEFFGKHPLATHVYGTEKTLGKLALRDIRRLHSRLVSPQNVVLSASGEFDAEKLLATLEAKFSAVVPVENSSLEAEDFRSVFQSASLMPAREREVSPPVPAEQAIVQLAFPDVGFCDERYWVGSLTDELLSGISSRLFLEIREKRGLAYFVGANRIGSPATGLFYLYAGTAKENVRTVLEEMRKEICRLREGKISAEELVSAKTRLCVARRSARQNAGSRCGNAALNALYGLPVNRDAEFESRVAALAVDDVARFATEVLCEEKSLALIVK